MNTIKHFNQLKRELNMSVIPDLVSARLDITPAKALLTLAEVQQAFNTFDPDSGWVLYRDALSTDMADFTRNDIIEGEWSKPGESLRIRLVEPGRYHFTQSKQTEGNIHAYQDISIRLQPVCGHTLATYRVWWRNESEGARQDRWEPFYQQFVGFDLGE